MKTKWSSLHNQGERFFAYFEKHKTDAIKQTMMPEIRAMVGLGWPPTVYTQNANECMNSVLQRIVIHIVKKEKIDRRIEYQPRRKSSFGRRQ